MNDATLHFVLRTPQRVVLETDISSLRLPTETGQVGLRPRSEACVLAVEPGLIVLRHEETVSFAGTAGGLLHCDGKLASLITPLAVAGQRLDDVQAELDQALAVPTAEREVRTMLARLEKNILQELQSGGEERIGPGGKST